MTDAGEKLEARALAWWRENGENACNTNDLVGCIRAELERAESDLGKLAKGKVRSYAAAIDDAVAAIRKLKE